MPRIHVRRITVEADQIDANRHVNNLVYLRWMLEVAIEHSGLQGWPPERYLESGSGWVVRSHHIEYLRPAFLGDALALATWVVDMRRQASTRRYLFFRPSDRRPVATAETLWVFVDGGSGRPTTIPEAVAGAFELVPDGTDIPAELDWLDPPPPAIGT